MITAGVIADVLQMLLHTGMLLRKMVLVQPVLVQPVLVWLPRRKLGMVVKTDGRREPPYIIRSKFQNSI